MSSRLAVLLVLWSALSGCRSSDAVERTASPIVYGIDDRVEVFEITEPTFRRVAENSIAVELSRDAIDESDPANIRVTYSRTLREAQSLCDGERFAEQIEPGTCSGTLIDDQHILTAGHCVDEASDCDGSRVWLFGFSLASAGALAALTVDDVYRCAAVVAYRDDDEADHAVVRLDRPVVGHAPATLRALPSGLALGTPLTIIGHPNGLPMKLAGGGEVTRTDGDGVWLLASLDSFDGNSGSGVFDAEGKLVALLDGGLEDYVARGDCNIVHTIAPPEDGDTETLTYLKPALDAFCATPSVSSAACDCDGPCVEGLPGDTCGNPERIEATTQTLNGSLNGFTPTREGSCGGGGADRVWLFDLETESRVTARSEGFDTVLYLENGCGETEVACHDDVDTDTDRGSFIEAVLEPGSYALTLDAYDTDVGSFTVELTVDATRAPNTDSGAGLDAGRPLADASVPDAAMTDAEGEIADEGGCESSRLGAGRAPVFVVLFVLLYRKRQAKK